LIDRRFDAMAMSYLCNLGWHGGADIAFSLWPKTYV